jgi:hypothetical protein
MYINLTKTCANRALAYMAGDKFTDEQPKSVTTKRHLISRKLFLW